MIVGNFMVINQIDEREAFRWFVEFAIDAYDWVMHQNVYDMLFFVSGGRTTKKPYCTSASYVLRMSDYKKNEKWVKIWNETYDTFIQKNTQPLYVFRRFYPGVKKKLGSYDKKSKAWHYDEFPTFKPNLTPSEIMTEGAFGGTYWRTLKSLRDGSVMEYVHLRYPKVWWKGVRKPMTLPWKDYDVSINKHKVQVGQTYEEWYGKGWISEWNEYGWFHWYCDFFMGRRCEDDERQIKRWVGVRNRFGKRYEKMLKEGKGSPKIAQTLLHWGISF